MHRNSKRNYPTASRLYGTDGKCSFYVFQGICALVSKPRGRTLRLFIDFVECIADFYVKRTLLSAPFISFIVLFCHVIGKQDRIDLERLHGFILSMESAPEISDAAVKMLRLFQVLYTVAVRYVELHSSTSTIHHTQASQDLDAYIAELGLPIPFSSRQQNVAEGVTGQDGGGLGSGSQAQSTMGGINWQQDGNLMMASGTMFGLENWVYNNY